MIATLYTMMYGNPALWGDLLRKTGIARVFQHAGRVSVGPTHVET